MDYPFDVITKNLQAAGSLPAAKSVFVTGEAKDFEVTKCPEGQHEYEYDEYDYSDDNQDGMAYAVTIGTCKKCGDTKDINYK